MASIQQLKNGKWIIVHEGKLISKNNYFDTSEEAKRWLQKEMTKYFKNVDAKKLTKKKLLEYF